MNLQKTSYSFLLLLLICVTNYGKAQTISIIPKPMSLKVLDGDFAITSSTSIEFDKRNDELDNIAQLFHSDLLEFYHVDLPTNSRTQKAIKFQIEPESNFGNEGYSLIVNPEGILISASAPGGVFYGVQTLKQLLPVVPSGDIVVPCVEIKDEPRFKWRGLMLDVCRHYWPVFQIKKLLDEMALFKMNTFHWHLTEDQGWRIEIKKYPELTNVASWRNQTIVGHKNESNTYDGIGYGGFYTQDQIRDIVSYAKERFIDVVPEIEMPGHSTAVLAAYPELGCTGGPYEVAMTWGVFKDVYCAGKEQTFKFLEDVLDEVCELFPSRYVHIGGDECPKDLWQECEKCQKRIKDEDLKDEHELQSYFIKRIEKYLEYKNKRLIGWDEILEGGIAPEATVMSWRGIRGGIEATQLGHDVIMTPTSHCYFDHYQSKDKESEPLAIGGFLPLKKVYNYEPVPDDLNEQQASHILGAQANVWTEYITNIPHLEYMIFPRLCALSEVVWSTRESKNFVDFQTRLETTYLRLKLYNINYRDYR